MKITFNTTSSIFLLSILFWSCCADEEVAPEEENTSLGAEWKERIGFGESIYGYKAFSIGEKGYITTGMSGDVSDENYLNALWEYDPATSSWAQKADYPGPARRGTSSFVLNNEAYVGLGFRTSAIDGATRFQDFYKYNPGSNSWTQLNDFDGGARNAVYTFVVDDKA